MAKIVLGMAASHGPLAGDPARAMGTSEWRPIGAIRRWSIATAPSNSRSWPSCALTRTWSEQIKLPVKQKRYDACQRAMAEMARVFKEVQPDVAVLVGNDQMEVFEDANIPAFMVCFGDSVDNIPFSDEQKKRLAPGIEIAEPNHHGKTAETYPGHPKLGRHLIEALVERDFDVAASARLPQSASSNISGLPHAYGFIYRRIMQDNFVPGGAVLHQHVLSAQPAEHRRCFSLGTALAEAIDSWDEDLRVAVIGSGGMSHFVVDEELDRGFLDAMQRKDAEALISIPPYNFRSGTSELKNWIPVAGAMNEVGAEHDADRLSAALSLRGRHRQRNGVRLLELRHCRLG